MDKHVYVDCYKCPSGGLRQAQLSRAWWISVCMLTVIRASQGDLNNLIFMTVPFALLGGRLHGLDQDFILENNRCILNARLNALEQ